MRILLTFARAYPGQSAAMLLALLLAGVAEGVGLSALLPLLNLAVRPQAASTSAAAPAEPSGVGKLIEELLATVGLRPTLNTLLVVLVLGIAAKSGLVLLAKKRVGYTVAHVATDLRLRLLRTLFATRWSYFLRQPVGALANAVGAEAMQASSAYLYGATLASFAIQTMIYSAIALMVSWKATVAALIAASCTMVLLGRFVRKARRAGKRQTRLLKSLSARLTDSLQSVKPLKAMARESAADSILEAETGRLNRALEKKVLSKEALNALQEPIFVGVIAAGLYAALVHWHLPFTSVMVLTFLLARVLTQTGKIQREYQRMAACDAAYWSLLSTIDEARREREHAVGTRTPTLERGIALERVDFSYTGPLVLEQASMTIRANRMTTVVGPSGAGKTTVADLVTGLLQPTAGVVEVDGTPLPELDLRKWRQMIGYVPQDTFLLHDSILTNVTLGDPGLGREQAERALRAAGAWEFVQAMPEGIDSTVGERGGRLSGGQRQRIAVARALVHEPRLLILDEATSALDPESEAAICGTLWQLKERVTLLAISHQPALVDAADRVYRVEGGAVTLVADRDGGSASPGRAAGHSRVTAPDRAAARGDEA